MRILLLLLVCLNLSLRAQIKTSTAYEIQGKVADSVSGKHLDYITVTLKTGEKQPVKTTLTAADGSFNFSGLDPAKYLLTVVAVGYKPELIAVDLNGNSKKNHDLGTIYISTKARQLDQVVVTADKAIVKQEIDRISYDIQADPESKVNNVLQMMRKVPLLSVDADDNIKLQGDGNFKILVNGKPSGMMERSARDILRSMPASSIQKIEVITTPPAKYDGEGLTGIINIITNKKVDNGYNGSLNISERFPIGGPGAGGSFTVKSGKFGISGNTGANIYGSPLTENSNYRGTAGASPTTLMQQGNVKPDSRNAYFGTEISYEPDSLNLVSGQFNMNGGRSESLANQFSVLYREDAIHQRYDLASNNQGRGEGIDASLNYQLGFKADKNRLLTFSFSYYRFSNDQFNGLAVSNPVNFTTPDFNQSNTGTVSEKTFQVDYVHPFKKLNIEAGIKGIFRNNRSDFQYHSFDSESGLFELDPSRTNKFNNTQDVLGAYNTYQYNLKDWGFKAGVRIEQTLVDADFISSSFRLDQKYTNLIPSLSINRKFKDMSSLNFGYTTRINRPAIFRLNPFVDRSNPDFESSGNPGLKPTTGTTFRLTYSKSKKGSVNIGVGYNIFSRLIMPVSVFDPVANITRKTFDNMGKARLISSNLNITYPLGNKWNYRQGVSFFYGWVQGVVNDEPAKNEGAGFNLYSSTDYRFKNSLRLNADFNFIDRDLSLQGRTNAFFTSSFSISKDVVKDKLTFSAACNNPFTKFRSARSEINGSNFTQQSYSQSYLRTFSLSLNYRFGSLKESIKKNKRGIKNDDVSRSANE